MTEDLVDKSSSVIVDGQQPPNNILETQLIKQASIQNDNVNTNKELTPKEVVAPVLKAYNTIRRENKWQKTTFGRGSKKRTTTKEFNEVANELAKVVSAVKTAETSRIKRQKIMYRAHGLKMGFLYKIQKTWMKYMICVLVGCLAGLISFLLLKNTGTYSSGLGGISQGIARITQIELAKAGFDSHSIEMIYNAMFWGIIVLLNIPLLIFAYFKIDKRFAAMTSVFLITQNIVGFALGYIPNTENLFIFGSTAGGININWECSKIPDIEIQNQLKKALQIVTWTGSGYEVSNGQGARIVSVFAYALTFSLFNGIYLSAIYILGGSSGGTDIIASYISKIKVKSVGGILTYFNIASLIIGVAIGSFSPVMILGGIQPIAGQEIDPVVYISLFFSPNLLASFLGTIIAGLTLNALFPKHKAVKVQVYSKDVRLIANTIHANGWSHQVVVNNNNDDSLSWTSKTNLETFCFYLELPDLIKTIRNLDKEALILIFPVSDIDGEMVTTVTK